jgi:hypothetical protein
VERLSRSSKTRDDLGDLLTPAKPLIGIVLGTSVSNFAVLAGTVPVALAAFGSLPAYLRIAWQDFAEYSANGCCDGGMVQFVALFLTGAATLVDYSVRRLPRSVASVGA